MRVEVLRTMPRALRELVLALTDAVFPARCAVCGGADRGDGLGCDAHRLSLRLSGPRCGRCALALPSMLADRSLCRECRARAPAFRRVTALADYRADEGTREWILAFKHHGRRDLAREMGRALGAALAGEAPRGEAPTGGTQTGEARTGEAPDARRDDTLEHAAGSRDRDAPDARRPVLVPVPLHLTRHAERGYDQARLLARHAAEVESLDVIRALRRTRSTAVQGALGSPSRTANVHGAFEVVERASARLADRDVWLVDDVLTSGATADECARVLRRAGARSVSVLVVARAG